MSNLKQRITSLEADQEEIAALNPRVAATRIINQRGPTFAQTFVEFIDLAEAAIKTWPAPNNRKTARDILQSFITLAREEPAYSGSGTPISERGPDSPHGQQHIANAIAIIAHRNSGFSRVFCDAVALTEGRLKLDFCKVLRAFIERIMLDEADRNAGLEATRKE